ncbi:MAG: hypothetical protein HYX32_00925 [Actinobacteria bacterium]|nr:hypothetical protein [Actinomycetota bacterium]
MERLVRWLHARLHRGDRAATLVEYALLVAFFGVLSIGSGKYLTTQANSQVNNQADCVSYRPPPKECQVRALNVTTSTTNPPTTATTAGPTTTAPPPAALNPPPSFTKKTVGGYPTVGVSLTLRSGSGPVPGATIRFSILVYAPGMPSPGYVPQTTTCTTDAAGTCNFDYPSTYNNTNKMTVTITDVTSTPTFGGSYPAPVTFTWP